MIIPPIKLGGGGNGVGGMLGGVGSGGLGWEGGGVRVDVNEELKFLGKFTNKKSVGGREGGRWGCRVGGGGGGVRTDVNAMLGLGGDVGYRGCEPRIEGILRYTKSYYTILRK